MTRRPIAHPAFVTMGEAWPRPSGAQWAALAFAAAVAAAAIALSITERGRLASIDAVSMRPASRAPAKAASSPSINAAQLAELNQAVRQLNIPTVALMSALSAPKSMPVALDSLEFKSDAAKGDGHLLVEAEAADADTMIEYLDLLATRRPIREVSLVKHQLIPATAGMTIRFQADARWHEETR